MKNTETRVVKKDSSYIAQYNRGGGWNDYKNQDSDKCKKLIQDFVAKLVEKKEDSKKEESKIEVKTNIVETFNETDSNKPVDAFQLIKYRDITSSQIRFLRKKYGKVQLLISQWDEILSKEKLI